jgi:hypothetical protein
MPLTTKLIGWAMKLPPATHSDPLAPSERSLTCSMRSQFSATHTSSQHIWSTGYPFQLRLGLDRITVAATRPQQVPGPRLRAEPHSTGGQDHRASQARATSA